MSNNDNNKVMQELNSYTCPLAESNMISAGAGTGKTYNIQILVLREILKGITIEKILVVTFTDLATQELQDRIRRIIQNALHVCDTLLKYKLTTRQELENTDFVIDNDIEQVLPCFGLASEPEKNVPDDERPKTLEEIKIKKRFIENALRNFDDAPISTIHGFCSRMLQENTFESGVRYGMELRSSCKALVKSIICDFFRNFCSKSKKFQRPLLLKLLNYTPDKIASDLKELLDNTDAYVNWGEEFRGLSDEEADSKLNDIENAPIWTRFAEALQNVDDSQLSAFCVEINGNPDKFKFLRQIGPKHWLLAAIDEINAASKNDFSYSAPPSFQQNDTLAPEEIELRASYQEAFVPNVTEVQDVSNIHPANAQPAPFDSIPALLDKYRRLIIKLAFSFAQKELAQAKENDGFMTFDDLLTALKNKIVCTSNSEFINLIRNKFDCVMIDEFQDTDPTQSTIFSRLFSPSNEDADKSRLLIMIGDEKQAIYKFRGGDVQTFQKMTVEAKNKYTLKRNFRSTRDFIESMNDFWLNTCEGKFFSPANIVFEKIGVGKDDGECIKHLSSDRALKGGELLSKGTAEKNINDVFVKLAREILELKRNYCKATFKDGKEERKEITFKDIAILVRSAKRVDEIRNVLRRHGISSAFMKVQSIFKTSECNWMLDFLDAILEPGNQSKALRFLAGKFFGLSLPRLEAIRTYCLANFQTFLKELNELWHKKSFFAMFTKFSTTPWDRQMNILPPYDDGRHILNCMTGNTPAVQIVQNAPDAERTLSIINQIAETLMKVASERHLEPGALFAFLEKKIRTHKQSAFNDDTTNSTTEEENDDEEFPVHLTTQDDAVQILTIHKSKGLEYPFVFVPNFTVRQNTQPNRNKIYHDISNGEPIRTVNMDFQNASTQEACAQEAIAEHKRLMYVAITRAKYFCRFLGTITGLNREDKEIISEYKYNGWDALKEKQPILLALLKGKKSDKNLLKEFIDKKWIVLSPEEQAFFEEMTGRKNADKEFLKQKIAECLQNLPTDLRPTLFDFLSDWNTHPEILLPQMPFPNGEQSAASEQEATSDNVPLSSAQEQAPSETISIDAESLNCKPDSGNMPTSFSSISKGTKAPEEPTTSKTTRDDDDPEENFPLDGPPMTPYDERTPIFQFPGGIRTGICWHEIMENLDFTQWQTIPTPEVCAAVEKTLLHYSQLGKAMHDERLHAFLSMLVSAANFPFFFVDDTRNIRLYTIPKENTIREFNFTFMMREGIEPETLSELLQKDCIDTPENWRHSIASQPLTGSIDFLFQEPTTEKFYILDWKTNIIGANADNFTPEGVKDEVTRRFYSLQCVLYALAFIQYHRQTYHSACFAEDQREQFAKEAYDAFGGCADVFLRGLNAENGNGVHYIKPSWNLLNALDKYLGVSFKSSGADL